MVRSGRWDRVVVDTLANGGGNTYHSKSIRSSRQPLLSAVPTVVCPPLFWLDLAWASVEVSAFVVEAFARGTPRRRLGWTPSAEGVVMNWDRFRSFIRIIID